MVIVPAMVAAPSAVVAAAPAPVRRREFHAVVDICFGIRFQFFEIRQNAGLRRRTYRNTRLRLRLWQNRSNRCGARKAEQASEKQSSIHALPPSITRKTLCGSKAFPT